MVTIQQVKAGVVKYIETDILPHLAPWKQIAMKAYVLMAADNVARMILEMRTKPEIAVMGVIQDNGDVDIDRVYQIMASMMQSGEKIPFTIPFLKDEFKLDKSDLDRLYKYIKEG